MRTPIVSIYVELDEFDTDEIIDYLKDLGYTVSEKDKPLKPEAQPPVGGEFSFQKQVIAEVLENAINKHGYNYVMTSLEQIFGNI